MSCASGVATKSADVGVVLSAMEQYARDSEARAYAVRADVERGEGARAREAARYGAAARDEEATCAAHALELARAAELAARLEREASDAVERLHRALRAQRRLELRGERYAARRRANARAYEAFDDAAAHHIATLARAQRVLAQNSMLASEASVVLVEARRIAGDAETVLTYVGAKEIACEISRLETAKGQALLRGDFETAKQCEARCEALHAQLEDTVARDGGGGANRRRMVRTPSRAVRGETRSAPLREASGALLDLDSGHAAAAPAPAVRAPPLTAPGSPVLLRAADPHRRRPPPPSTRPPSPPSKRGSPAPNATAAGDGGGAHGAQTPYATPSRFSPGAAAEADGGAPRRRTIAPSAETRRLVARLAARGAQLGGSKRAVLQEASEVMGLDRLGPGFTLAHWCARFGRYARMLPAVSGALGHGGGGGGGGDPSDATLAVLFDAIDLHGEGVVAAHEAECSLVALLRMAPREAAARMCDACSKGSDAVDADDFAVALSAVTSTAMLLRTTRPGAAAARATERTSMAEARAIFDSVGDGAPIIAKEHFCAWFVENVDAMRGAAPAR